MERLNSFNQLSRFHEKNYSLQWYLSLEMDMEQGSEQQFMDEFRKRTIDNVKRKIICIHKTK